MSNENSLRRFLETSVEMRRMMGNRIGPGKLPLYSCPEELVLKHGVTPTRKLESPVKGAPQECFANAYRMMLSRPDEYTYTEGYFMSVIPLHHAWITLEDGSIYDPTLNDERGPENYLGVPFTYEFMEDHIAAMEEKFDGAYPAVLVGPDELYNMDVLNGAFEVAHLAEVSNEVV